MTLTKLLKKTVSQPCRTRSNHHYRDCSAARTDHPARSSRPLSPTSSSTRPRRGLRRYNPSRSLPTSFVLLFCNCARYSRLRRIPTASAPAMIISATNSPPSRPLSSTLWILGTVAHGRKSRNPSESTTLFHASFCHLASLPTTQSTKLPCPHHSYNRRPRCPNPLWFHVLVRFQVLDNLHYSVFQVSQVRGPIPPRPKYAFPWKPHSPLLR